MYANEDIPKATASFPAGNLVTLNNTDAPKVTRVEAMNQYDLSSGTVSKWVVAASMPSSTVFPWEVWSYEDLGNTNPLSTNYSGSTADLVSPAVAAGVSPMLSGNIGNTQYTTGYYPRDYNNLGAYQNIWSRSVDVYTGAMSSSELQVDNSSVNYDWDVNRIYAVSNCSNSGFNILSAYFNGGDIVYKESPNSFVYKQSSTTTVKTIASLRKDMIYPNPAFGRLYVANGKNRQYSIADITGKMLLSGSYNSNGIDVSSLTTGFYVLRLTDEHGSVTSVKFTKQ